MIWVSHRVCLVSTTTLFSYAFACAHFCTLQTMPEWENLEKRLTTSERFGTKLILIGSLMFKKKAPEPIVLNHLQLQWHGVPLSQLSASLYQKKDSTKLIPIEDNLISDGQWLSTKQKILFRFNKPYHLTAHTQFYIVVSIPPELEQNLQLGSFTIEKSSMPDLLQCSVPDTACVLHMAHHSSVNQLSTH